MRLNTDRKGRTRGFALSSQASVTHRATVHSLLTNPQWPQQPRLDSDLCGWIGEGRWIR